MFRLKIFCWRIIGIADHTLSRIDIDSSRCLVISISLCKLLSRVDSKFNLFRSLRSILIDLKSTVNWTVSILIQIFCSHWLFSIVFGIFPRAPNIIGITVTFIFHKIFSSFERFKYLLNFSLSSITFWPQYDNFLSSC